MPIRTNRGRAAVYRRIWGAPLRSPKHLIVTVVVLVAVVTAIGFVIPRVLPGDPKPASSQSGEPSPAGSTGEVQPPTTDGTSATETRLSEFPATPKSAAPSPAGLSVARKWALAWVHHPKGTTSKEWVAGLRPYTDPEYLTELRTVKLERIPAEKVIGKATAVHSTAKAMDVDVRTDGPRLRITVIKSPDGWLVTGYSEGE